MNDEKPASLRENNNLNFTLLEFIQVVITYDYAYDFYDYFKRVYNIKF